MDRVILERGKKARKDSLETTGMATPAHAAGMVGAASTAGAVDTASTVGAVEMTALNGSR